MESSSSASSTIPRRSTIQASAIQHPSPKKLAERYEGERNTETTAYHGHGTYYYKNHDLYVGEWRNGQRWGKGKMSYAASKDWYEGEYVDNKAHGQGKYFFASSNDLYEGQFKRGLRHGQGTQTCSADGSVYSGMWRKGKKHGLGMYKYAEEGDYFEGYFVNDVPHGAGTLATLERLGKGVLDGEGEEEKQTPIEEFLANAQVPSEKIELAAAAFIEEGLVTASALLHATKAGTMDVHKLTHLCTHGGLKGGTTTKVIKAFRVLMASAAELEEAEEEAEERKRRRQQALDNRKLTIRHVFFDRGVECSEMPPPPSPSLLLLLLLRNTKKRTRAKRRKAAKMAMMMVMMVALLLVLKK